jgi:hypothetical protein
MDPNANLEEQRKIAARMLKQVDEPEGIDEHDADRLAELVLALDEWISKGGFLPARWE